MRKLLIILALTLISLPSFGGEIFVVKNKMEADVVVYVTEVSHEADIWVKMTNNSSEARTRDYCWRVEEGRYSYTIKVYYTKHKYEADLVVFFHQPPGWKKPHPLQGRLH